MELELMQARVSQPDLTAKSSFFGLAAPPIQAIWSYEQLVQEARAGSIASVQIAVQHDCVIATSTSGQRYSTLLPDKRFPELLADVMLPDGSTPFEVLPLDAARANVRDAAFTTLNILGTLWLADLAGLLPWDTTPYSSLAEREKIQAGREKVQAGLGKSKLGQWLRALTAKKSVGARDHKKEQGTSVTREEALKRVLGLTTWDAAAELKAKLRPRKFEQGILEARPHKLEIKIFQAHAAARTAALELKASVNELKGCLHEVPWATPSAISTDLPPLELLFAQACRIHWENGVVQYIRAHPSTDMNARVKPLVNVLAAEELQAGASQAVGAFPKFTFCGGTWPVNEEVEIDAVLDDDILGDTCCLSPDFSAIYNHNVYICKRLAPVPA
jgi:hypothetical protein